MKKQIKETLSFISRVALSGGLLYFLLSRNDSARMIEVIKSADINFLLYGLIVFCFINLVIFFRWLILVRALDLSAPFITLFRYHFIGLFGNLFLPTAVGGDVIKIWGVCRHTQHKPKVVASVILDRLCGYGAIVIISVLVYFLGYSFHNESSLFVPILCIGLVSVAAVIVLFNEKVYSLCCAIFQKLPKVRDILMNIHYDIVLLKGQKKEGMKAIALSCFTQVLFAGTYYLVARALHQEIAFVYFLIFVPLICVAAAVPSIGGLGVREAGAAFLFAKIGIDTEIAVSLSLINFVYMIVIGMIGGILYIGSVPSGSTKRDNRDNSENAVST